jgi:hypothetical protein
MVGLELTKETELFLGHNDDAGPLNVRQLVVTANQTNYNSIIFKTINENQVLKVGIFLLYLTEGVAVSHTGTRLPRRRSR